MRYLASGVSVVWLVRGAHLKALSNSRISHHTAQGWTAGDAMNRAMDDMPYLPLDDPIGDEVGPRVVVYPLDRSTSVQRLTLEVFGAGVASGALQLGKDMYLDGSRSWPAWMWDRSKVPQILLEPESWL